MHVRFLKAFLSAAALCGSGLAFGWGDVGHTTVCQVAYDHATPSTREALKELLGNRSFARQCIWPDQVKNLTQVPKGQTPDPEKLDWSQTYGYHFVNYEDGDHWASERPEAFTQGGDMIQQLLVAKRAIVDQRRSKASRLCHLRFLGHLAGDSHQPLHVGHGSDRGGNKVLIPLMGLEKYRFKAMQLVDGKEKSCTERGDEELQPNCFVIKEIVPDQVEPKIRERGDCRACLNLVTFTEIPTSAHGLWDDGFIELRGRQLINEGKMRLAGADQHSDVPFAVFPAYAAFVQESQRAGKTPESRLSMWDDLMRWTELSADMRDFAYIPEGFPTGPVPSDPSEVNLITDERAAAAATDPYVEARVKLIEERLVQAGMHLAGQLNRAFDPAFRADAVREFGEAEILAREVAGELREKELEDRIALRRKGKFTSQCDRL